MSYPIEKIPYCDSCASKRKWYWPTIFREVKQCGVCGEQRTCNREPS